MPTDSVKQMRRRKRANATPDPLAPYEELIITKLELEERVKAAIVKREDLELELNDISYINARAWTLARRSEKLKKTWADIREDRQRAADRKQHLLNSVGIIRFHYNMLKVKIARCFTIDRRNNSPRY